MFLRREDYTSRELFTHEDFLRHYAESRGCKMEELCLHELVIGSFSPAAIQELQRACEPQPTPHSHFHRGSSRRKLVSLVRLVRFPPRAPMAAATLEEAIVCGGPSFLIIGLAGIL